MNALLKGKFGDSKDILHNLTLKYGIDADGSVNSLKVCDPLQRNGLPDYICDPSEIRVFNRNLSGSDVFVNLFNDRLANGISNKPTILKDIFEDDCFGIAIKKGFEFGQKLHVDIELLFTDVLNHIRLISIVDIDEPENQFIGVRNGLCQSVSTHSIPFCIFISPTSLVDPFVAAEAVFHESLHKKLSSLVSIYDIFPETYDFKNSPTIDVIWNPSLKWNSNKWPLDRALFALHFYIHAVFFYDALDKIDDKPSYLNKYDISARIKKSISVSIYLYKHIANNIRFLGSDAKELLDWLQSIMEKFPILTISYDEVCAYLLLDLHRLWTKELDSYLRRIESIDKLLVSPTSEEGWTILEIVRHFFHSEVETIHRLLTVANQNSESKLSNYPVEWWASNTTDTLSISEYTGLIVSLRKYTESVFLQNISRFDFRGKKYTTKHSTRSLLDILYISSNHPEYHVKDIREAMASKNNTIKLDFLGAWNGARLNDKEIDIRFQWLKSHLVDKNICKASKLALESDKFIICSLFYELSPDSDLMLLFENLTKRYIKLFSDISDVENSLPPSITALLPDSFEPNRIFAIENELRERLISQNIVFGFLSPKSDMKTLFGSDFEQPYKSPYNFITIRFMVRDDRRFMEKNPILLERYSAIFGDSP